MKNGKFFIVLVMFWWIVTPNLFANDNILNIYTWAGYLPDSVIQAFEAETGIQVNHSTYVNNEVLYAKLKANPDVGYDVVIPSTYFISRMVKQDMLQKIDKSKLFLLKNIDPVFLNKEHDPENEYGVPYLWNSTGIAVNTRYHSKESVLAWRDLWNSRYKNQLLMLDDAREIFAVALLTLGYSVNETNPVHIQSAFLKLQALMDNIKLFNLDAQRSIYLDEDITLGMGWNGDIFIAKQENSNLAFIYPTEGYIVALDCVAIPKGAKHVEAAHRFIDFILRGSVAKEISESTGFSTPNIVGRGLLPDNIRNDEILYPNAEILKRAHLLTDVGELAPLYEKYYELLKLETR